MNKYFVLLLAIVFLGLTAKAQNANRFFPEKDLITTGI